MQTVLKRIEIKVPLDAGQQTIAGDSISVESYSDTGLIRSQKTNINRLHLWLTGVVGRSAERSGPVARTWLDFLTLPTPLVIGQAGPRTTVLLIRTWPEGHQWDDAIGKQKFAIPPVIIGGTWDTEKKVLLWSGVAVTPVIPSKFDPAFLVHPWPFGNVWDDGHICWGENSTKDLNTPAAISVMANRFFDTPFNQDLRRAGWTIDDKRRAVMTNSRLQIDQWVR